MICQVAMLRCSMARPYTPAVLDQPDAYGLQHDASLEHNKIGSASLSEQKLPIHVMIQLAETQKPKRQSNAIQIIYTASNYCTAKSTHKTYTMVRSVQPSQAHCVMITPKSQNSLLLLCITMLLPLHTSHTHNQLPHLSPQLQQLLFFSC